MRSVDFSALQRAEIAEIKFTIIEITGEELISVLFNEPKLLKYGWTLDNTSDAAISVLFNEPKLLKYKPDKAT